jgi:hypothetical protein
MCGVLLVVFVGACELRRRGDGTTGGEADKPKPSESGVTVRSEVLAVWAPQALIDLVHHQGAEMVGLSPEAFRTFLKQHGLSETWCVKVFRNHQENGETTDMALTVLANHPRRPIERLQELVSVIAGNPESSAVVDYSHTTVKAIPTHLLTADPYIASKEMFEITTQLRTSRRDPEPPR